jgi:hypothetical protein
MATLVQLSQIVQFSGHAGEAVIIVFHQDDIAARGTKLPAMRVVIEWCVFDDNLVSTGTNYKSPR